MTWYDRIATSFHGAEGEPRVRRMLDALAQEGLDKIPDPTFTWEMRAGLHNIWSVRLAWRDSHGHFNLFLNIDTDDESMTWRLDEYAWGEPTRTTGRKATLREAEIELGGMSVLERYGQKTGDTSTRVEK